MDHHLPRAVTPRVAPKHTGVVMSDMLGFERVGGTVGGAYVGVMVRVTENLTRVMGE